MMIFVVRPPVNGVEDLFAVMEANIATEFPYSEHTSGIILLRALVGKDSCKNIAEAGNI